MSMMIEARDGSEAYDWRQEEVIDVMCLLVWIHHVYTVEDTDAMQKLSCNYHQHILNFQEWKFVLVEAKCRDYVLYLCYCLFGGCNYVNARNYPSIHIKLSSISWRCLPEAINRLYKFTTIHQQISPASAASWITTRKMLYLEMKMAKMQYQLII